MPHSFYKRFIFITASALAIGSLAAITERLVTKSIDELLPPTSKVDLFSRPGTIELLSSNGTIIQKLGPVTREKIKPN